MGFQRLAVDHVDRSFKQSGYVVLERDVIENRYTRCGIDFHQDIDIAVGSIVSASNRAKKRRVTDALRTKSVRVLTKDGDGVLPSHNLKLAQLTQFNQFGGICPIQFRPMIYAATAVGALPLKTSSPDFTPIFTRSPSLMRPERMSSASGSCTDFWITRLSGRAP